jgi:hypothetical protein
MANELKFGNKVVFLNGLPLTLPIATSDPGSAVAGDLYYNSSSNAIKVYNGSAWNVITTGSISLTGQSLATGSIIIGESGVSAAVDTTGQGDILASASGLTIKGGAITNSEIASGAGIVYSKLTLTSSIMNSDIASGAAIAYSKLNLGNSVLASDQNSSSATSVQPLFANGSGGATYRSIVAGDLPNLSSTYLTVSAAANSSSGTAGSTLIGDNNSYSHFTPTATTVKGALSGIDTALAGLSAAAITSLTGDVTATGPGASAATVAFVGGSTAAAVHTATVAANAATNTNTASTIVERDSSGNFSAGTITASLTGHASLDVALSSVGVANGVASLDSGGKVPLAQLPNTVMEYQQAWNANTNTPTLSDGSGTNGYVYRTSVAGTTTFGTGNTATFAIGDLVIYSGTLGQWQKAPAADGVSSVNSMTGAVVVNAINQLTGDVAAGPASGSASAAATIQPGAVTALKLGTVTDGITLDQSGSGSTLEVKTGGISDAQISATAAIQLSKLAALTANIVPVTNSSGIHVSSTSSIVSLLSGGLNRGLTSSNVVSEVYNDSIVLTDNSTSAVSAFQFSVSSVAGLEISYVIETGTTSLDTRIGTLFVTCSNGGTPVVSLSDVYSESATCGVVWAAAVSGGVVSVSYTCANQGYNRNMRADVKSFRR